MIRLTPTISYVTSLKSCIIPKYFWGSAPVATRKGVMGEGMGEPRHGLGGQIITKFGLQVGLQILCTTFIRWTEEHHVQYTTYDLLEPFLMDGRGPSVMCKRKWA